MFGERLKSACRLLVVFDKQGAKNNLLINAVNLAKLLNGAIDILYVINPNSIADSDSQLNVLRKMEEENSKVDKKLRKLVNEIFEQERIPILYNIVTGNFQFNVKAHIEKTKPEVVVLQNNSNKTFFSSKKNFVPSFLSKFKGLVFLSGATQLKRPEKSLKLSCFESLTKLGNNKLFLKLLENVSAAIYVFRATDSNDPGSTNDLNRKLDKKTTVYEFDINRETTDFSKYLFLSNTDILCVSNSIDGKKSMQYDKYKNVIRKNKLPLLIFQN
tara:strand:- start:1458 stop:2273 length:816 start_codon:yes stop_codon:yes gene_type:complete